MTPRAKNLLREALALSENERADMAAELIASLDAPSDEPEAVESAWAAEIARRAGRVLSGETAGESWSEVRQRIAARPRES
ncbi:MAG: addiction module protein [Chloroflexi bacterium]|nr:addiction module protein [Chloroflexota bacterium]